VALTPGRGTYIYTASTDGNEYRVLIPKWLGTDFTTEFGFAADDDTKPPLPRYIKMRYITLLSNTTARHRKIHCGTDTCSGWTTLATSFTLYDNGGTAESYKSVGQVGEKRRGSIS